MKSLDLECTKLFLFEKYITLFSFLRFLKARAHCEQLGASEAAARSDRAKLGDRVTSLTSALNGSQAARLDLQA